MPEFHYAKGRISESLRFISQEMREFDQDYAEKGWKEYQQDPKLQKLIDRTVENILTALIEVSGTILAEQGTGVESYGEALRRVGKLFGFSVEEQEALAKLAMRRNQLAHRYLNFRWQAIRMYAEQRELIQKFLGLILEREKKTNNQ